MWKYNVKGTHPSRPANCTLFCLEVWFLFRSLSTDPRTLLCKRRIEDFTDPRTLLCTDPRTLFVRGALRIFIERKLSNLSALQVLSPVNM